ncbi:MAG: translation initiation factor IF-2 subunit beta [Promethearchaeota archaeon]
MPPKKSEKSTKSGKPKAPAKATSAKKSSPKTSSKSTGKAKTPSKTKTKTKTSKTPKPKVADKPKTSSKAVKADDYEALLTRARNQIPPEVFDQPRFKVPKVDSFIQGSRTVVRNFKDLTDTLRRDPKHLLRYLNHELATAGEIRSPQAIFNGRFSSRVLDELIEKYTEEYVVCPVCQRPDTEMRREDRLLMLVCSACGGRTPLKG